MDNHRINEAAKYYEGILSEVSRKVVYLKPNDYSDESLAIGVIVEHQNGVDFSYVSSQSASDALHCLYGSEAPEQLNYAIRILKDNIYSDYFDINNDITATSLLKFGPVTKTECLNPAKYSRDYLEIASSLYRNYDCNFVNNTYISQDEVRTSLYDIASHINAFTASKLFKGEKLKLPNKKTIDIPIVGDNFFGAPVSFVTKKVSDAKTRAEAYIAKFNYVRERWDKEYSVIYVLEPSPSHKVNKYLVNDSISELVLVGAANGVEIKHENCMDKLANVILSDAAA